jgi:hypothetical protein|tara:strand:+ start:4361 stop:5767 length:1407 start_codon:yes stop_codon:yes gene_type:complete
MASTYTTGFSLEKIGSGEQSGAWGDTTNFNLDIVDRLASYKAVAITTNADTHTLTVREASPGSGTENLQDGMYRVIKFTGALDSNCTVTIAPNTAPAYFIMNNGTTDSGSSGPYSLIFTQGSGANITVENGKSAVIYCDGAGSGAAVVDAVSNLALATVTASGDITSSGTFNALGDTAASDKAAVGYTSAEGLILTGQGSTNDVTVKNDADADVLTIATGGTSVDIVGDVTASTVNADGDTSAGDNAAMGYTAAEGLILTGQGSTSDITVKNDADGTVFTVPTGTDDILFPDDAKAMWGTGSDMTVHWDGTDGHLTVTGTLNIDGSGETMATFVDDGAVTLYHNNSAKLATSAVGTTITGTLIATTDTDTSNTGSVTLDFGANQNFVLTFTGNVTLANPTTEQVGQAGVIVCIQDGTGSRTLSLGTDYETAAGAGITLSTAANAVDVIPYFVKASGSIQLGAVQLAFS